MPSILDLEESKKRPAPKGRPFLIPEEAKHLCEIVMKQDGYVVLQIMNYLIDKETRKVAFVGKDENKVNDRTYMIFREGEDTPALDGVIDSPSLSFCRRWISNDMTQQTVEKMIDRATKLKNAGQLKAARNVAAAAFNKVPGHTEAIEMLGAIEDLLMLQDADLELQRAGLGPEGQPVAENFTPEIAPELEARIVATAKRIKTGKIPQQDN